MELIGHVAVGLGVALTPVNLAFALLGALIGTLIGVLPGIGPIATIAMLLPLTFHLEPTAGLIMLAGIFYGAQYGGSTTAILINLPGETSSVVTILDGHAMARQGLAGKALGISAIGSFIAGTFATLVIAALAIPLARFAIEFGPGQYFALMLLGLTQFWLTRQYLPPEATEATAKTPAERGKAKLQLGIGAAVLAVAVGAVALGFVRINPVDLGSVTGIAMVLIAVYFFGYVFMFGKLTPEEARRVVVIVVLFFGAATLDSIRGASWPRIAFWLGIALVFLAADWVHQRRANAKVEQEELLKR